MIICLLFNFFAYLCTRLSPDGGIGRRAGLKHQWGNPSRFEPGSAVVLTALFHEKVNGSCET